MQGYDLFMLAVVAVATIFGARKGLAWQVASLTSIFASYYVAYRFRGPAAELIDVEPPWNTFLAMLVLYLGSSLAIWLAFRVVSGAIDSVKLTDFDRHAGAVLGFARGLLWCVIITLFAVTLLGDGTRRTIIQSRSGHYIAQLLDRADAVMPGELHQVLSPYIQSLDARFSQAYEDGRAAPVPGFLAEPGLLPAPVQPDPGGVENQYPDPRPPRWSEAGPGTYR